MKNLLKNVVCGTHKQCTRALFIEKKVKKLRLKKKKSETQTYIWEAQNTLPKCTLRVSLVCQRPDYLRFQLFFFLTNAYCIVYVAYKQYFQA